MSTSELIEDLAVPYVVVMYSVEQDGEWMRRAEYPELPGCVAESSNALEAMDELEAFRVKMIVDMRRRGEQPPRPRPPLRSGIATLGALNIDKFLADLLGETV